MEGLTTSLPRILLKHDHPQEEGKPLARGEWNPYFAARKKEFTNTANNKQWLRVGVASTTNKHAWVLTFYPAKETIL